GAFSIVALEIAIDAFARDLERNALLRPSRHDLEGRPRHTNQMAIVLPAEIGFDLAAEIYWLRSHTILRPSRVRSGSTCWIGFVSVAMMVASPPVATHSTFVPGPPSSALIRRTSHSTMST